MKFEAVPPAEEEKFIEYYGNDAKRLMFELQKVGSGFLRDSVVTYGMYLPEIAYGISRNILEDRARKLFSKCADILEIIHFLESGTIKDEKVSKYLKIVKERAISLISKRFLIAQQQNEGTLWYLSQTESIQDDLETSDVELFINLYYLKEILERNRNVSVSELLDNSIGNFLINKLTGNENYIDAQSAGKVGKLKKFITKYGLAGFQTFQSLEHGGKEMGDKILELGELLPEAEARMIFLGYGKLVDSANGFKESISNAFSDKENKLHQKVPGQLYEALLLRAKDVLIGAHKIVSEDSGEKLRIENVTEALEGITLLLNILGDLEMKKKYEISSESTQEKNLFKYSVIDEYANKYNLKIFIRPEAEKNAQARINIELSFDTDYPNKVLQKAFYNEVESLSQNKTTAGSVLRIGIDREDFDGEGQVSLDLGRSERIDDKLKRTGDVLGNLLARASSEGHHTTSPFSPELGRKEVFKELALKLQDYLGSQTKQ